MHHRALARAGVTPRSFNTCFTVELLRDYTSSGHDSSILKLIFSKQLGTVKLVFRHKSLVNECMPTPSRPTHMHTNSMLRFRWKNIF